MTTEQAVHKVNLALSNYDKQAVLEAIAELTASRGRKPITITTQVNQAVADDLSEQAAERGLTLEEFVSEVLYKRALTHGYWN